MSAQNAKRVPLGANPGGAVLLTRLRIRFGGAPNRENGAKRLSALTRRGADPHYGIVNCWPARRCVWPVIAPAQALVRAGAGLRGDARSVGVVCVRCASVIAVLSGRFALGSRLPWVLLGRFAFGVRLSLRLCRGALRLVHACREVLLRRLRSVCVCHCGSVGAVCLGSRLLFVFRQTGRLAVPCVPVPPGRDRHSCVLAVLVRLSGVVETRSWSAQRSAFCRGGCSRFTLGNAVLLSRFVLRSRLLFVFRQTGRLASSCVPVPPGRDRHSCVLAALFGYRVRRGQGLVCGVMRVLLGWFALGSRLP